MELALAAAPPPVFGFPPLGLRNADAIVEQLLRCSASRADSDWEQFHQSFHRLISQVVTRTARRWIGSSHCDIEDLIQDTYMKLYRDRAQVLSGLEGRQPGEALAFIKVLATNLVHDHFKRTRCRKRGGCHRHDRMESLDALASGRWGVDAIERRILMQQIQRCLEGTSQIPATARRDQTVFWLYYRQGLTASAIARLPLGLTTKGVESLLRRLSLTVREELGAESLQRRTRAA
jgi:RNA polymerase sigma-70 factor, ECF subfamily